MFEDFYHLNENPFQINTDPRFLWLGEKHKEALAILQYGVLGNKSFLLLTGDVGTGKTTLINALLKGQGPETLIATIQDPDLSTLDLYNYIAYAFGMPGRYTSKGKFLVGFRKFLQDNYYKGKRVLLIVDEAQRTKQEILEDIRVLSNIEVAGNKLINIFFVGQNEFNGILLRDENKAIRQRITISYNIKSLTSSEVNKYIQFRLFKAGAKTRIFKKDAVVEIFKTTKGYPRLINILCDRCLVTGFVQGKKTIGRKIVKECWAEIDLFGQQASTKKAVKDELLSIEPSLSWWRLPIAKGLVSITCLAMFLGAGWLYYDDVKTVVSGSSQAGGFLAEEISASAATKAPPTAGLSPENQGGEKAGFKAAKIVVPKAEKGTGKMSDDRAMGREFMASGDERSLAISKTTLPLPLENGHKLQVFFQSDSISPAPEYIEEMKVFSDRFITLTDAGIIVRGYTDRSGSARYNKKLAKFRADVIKTFLAGRGVDVTKISTFGIVSAGLPAEKSIPVRQEEARRVELEVVRPYSVQ
ncbi:MAG: AAA family ATPase [Thermodesulfobacteriota bacterium]